MEPATVQEKREQAQTLIQDGYYADALAVLEGLARQRSPKVGEHARWVREQIPKVKGLLQRARSECQDAYRLAEQLFDDCNYAAAVELLEKFKRGSRTSAAEELLREAVRANKKVMKLNEQIDQGLYRKETDTDEFYDAVAALLELTPKDRRARQLFKKLEEERKKADYFGWRLGVAALGTACLFAVIWIIKLIFWPGGEGTVTFILDKPDLTVFVDGELLPASDFEKPLDRYKPGEHKLETRRGLDVLSRQTFTVEAKLDKIIHVGMEEDSVASADPVPDPLATDPLASGGGAGSPLDGHGSTPLDSARRTETPIEEPQPEPAPQPPPKPTTINGFPIAKQTGYLHLAGETVSPQYAVFSADATRVAAERLSSNSGDPEKTFDVTIWDTATGKAVQTLSLLSGDFQAMAFSPDGEMIATAQVQLPEAKGGTLQIWNVETGKLEQSLLLSIPPGQEKVQVKGVAFSADGKLAAAINQDAVFVWTVSDGQSKFQRSMAPAILTSIGFAPVPDVLFLGALGEPDGVMSWNLQAGTRIGYVDAGNAQTAHPAFAISPDRSVMAVINENNVRRYAVDGRLLDAKLLPAFLGETNVMQHVAYSSSGQYVMASGPGRRPLVWQDSDFTRVAILGESLPVASYAATLSPDSKLILQLDRADASDLKQSAAVLRTWQIAE